MFLHPLNAHLTETVGEKPGLPLQTKNNNKKTPQPATTFHQTRYWTCMSQRWGTWVFLFWGIWACVRLKTVQICTTSFSKAPIGNLSLPQVEKVCGSHAARPMMPSENPNTRHISTSASPPTSLTSDRSSSSSLPSVGPQQQSRRWDKNNPQ